jgi:hypothetical protein
LKHGKLAKFISDVQKYSGDLSIEAHKAIPKSEFSLDHPEGGKIPLPRTLEEWKTCECMVDCHKNVEHPAAECRVC